MFSPETLEYCEYCTMYSLEVGKGLRIFHTHVSGLPPLWLPTFWNSPLNGQLPSQPKLHHLISQDQKKKKKVLGLTISETKKLPQAEALHVSVGSCQLHKNFNRRDLTYSIINYVPLLYYK